MAATASTMIELGTTMPDFNLPEPARSRTFGSADLAGAKGVVVCFICNHCPFVKHIREGLIELCDYCHKNGVKMVAINSNDVENYPDDSPQMMKQEVEAHGYQFPYLFDETQNVAKAFSAACTPDFYVFDAEMKLTYRGQMDDSRPGSDVPVTGTDIREAINALIYDEPAPTDQKPSLGCNIKWKPGNEPSY